MIRYAENWSIPYDLKLRLQNTFMPQVLCYSWAHRKLVSLLLSDTFYWFRQTLAYYASELIRAIISFMIQATCLAYYSYLTLFISIFTFMKELFLWKFFFLSVHLFDASLPNNPFNDFSGEWGNIESANATSRVRRAAWVGISKQKKAGK